MSTAARIQRTFDASCRACPRLARLLDEVRREHPGYHAAPVPAFGARRPRLLIVGLAPGMHGANRTGRPFTGDHAGILLYRTLYRFGYASSPCSSAAADGLRLADCRVTNAVKCLPPENKPEASEVALCNRYLAAEVREVQAGGAIVALGAIAHRATLAAFGLRPSAHEFAHGSRHALPAQRVLFDSYHCSRYNTQTRRLTDAMFEAIFAAVAQHLDRA